MNKVKFLCYALLGYGLSLGPGLAADDVPECGWDPPVIEHSQQSVAVVTEDGQRITRQYKVQEASCKLLGADKCDEGTKFAGFGGSFTEDGTVTSAYPVCCEKDKIIKFYEDDKSGFWTCRNSMGRLTVTAHSGILCCPKTCPEDDPQEQADKDWLESIYNKCISNAEEISIKLLKEHDLWPLSYVDYNACGCPIHKLHDPCNALEDSNSQPQSCTIFGFCSDYCAGLCSCSEEGGCDELTHRKYSCSYGEAYMSEECCDGAYQTCDGGCAIQNPDTFLGDC